MERLTGFHCVHEALRARRRRLDRLWLRSDLASEQATSLRAAAIAAGVAVLAAPPEMIRREGSSNPQGVTLEAGPLPQLDLEELVEKIGNVDQSSRPRRLLALDGVEDPQNVGALIRVAEASGVDGLLLTNRRSPPLSPALARASAGAVEWLPVARIPNLARSIKLLKSNGFWVIGADPDASLSLFDAPDRLLGGPQLVLLGAEGRGLRPSIRALVDHALRIPMEGRVASLNVSAAGAVLLFELARRTNREQPA